MNASLTTAADVKNLTTVREFILKFAQRFCDEEEWLYDLTLAVDEAVTNIITHGYEDSDGLILIQVESFQEGLKVDIYDSAPTFDPTSYPDPDLPPEIEKRKPGGIGIYMMRKLTDQVNYCCLPDGRNELRLIKYFPKFA